MISLNLTVITNVIADLESKLAAEQRRIDDLLAPVMQDGKLQYFSPGDGYWQKRWVLENKLLVARKLLEEFRSMESKV